MNIERSNQIFQMDKNHTRSIFALMALTMWPLFTIVDFFNLPNGPFSSWEIIALYSGGACFLVLSIRALGIGIRFGKAELFFTMLLIYALFLNLVKENRTDWPVDLLVLACYFGLYLLVKNEDGLSPNTVQHILLTAFVFQMVMGLLQCINVLDSHDPYFKVLGGFSNPGPWGCFMALGGIMAFSRILDKRQIWIYIPLMVLFIISIGVSGSRTALISFGTGISMLFFWHWRSLRKKRVVMPLFFLGIVTVTCLYIYRPGSVDGRVFIWKRSLELFSKSPIFGIGTGRFQPMYMERQAAYFQINSHDSEAAFLADNIQRPFNEYLKLLVEYGLFGVLLLSSALYFLLGSKFIKMQKEVRTELALALGIGATSMFSYPLSEAPLTVVLAIVLGLLGRASENPITIGSKRKWALPFCLILMTSAIVCGTIRHIAYSQWDKAMAESLFGDRKWAIGKYISADKFLGRNGYFLYGYGSTLMLSDDLEGSLNKLKTSLDDHNNYQTHLLIGDIHRKTGRTGMAVKDYEHANNMVPNRFEPLYGLFQIYRETGRYALARGMAQRIVGKKIKIPSERVQTIVREAKEFLELPLNH